MRRLPFSTIVRLRAVPLLRGREAPLDPEQEAVLVVLVVVGLAAPGQLDGRVDEEGAEDVEHPGVGVDDDRTQRDEDAAQDDRDDDADHEGRLLELRRHLEAAHDEQEDEEVVDRQRVLGQPSGIELTGILTAPLPPDEEAEEDRAGDEEDEVASCLAHRGDMGSPRDDEDVDGEEHGHQTDRQEPAPGGNVHGHNLPVTKRMTGGLSRPPRGRTDGPGTGGEDRSVMTSPSQQGYSPP